MIKNLFLFTLVILINCQSPSLETNIVGNYNATLIDKVSAIMGISTMEMNFLETGELISTLSMGNQKYVHNDSWERNGNILYTITKTERNKWLVKESEDGFILKGIDSSIKLKRNIKR